MTSPAAAFAFARRTPCLVLLVVQLAGVVLYPFMETTNAGRAAFALFGLLVLALILLTLRVTPFLTWIAVLGAAPSAVLLTISVFVGSSELLVWSAAFEMVVYFYAAASMLAYMLHDEHVTVDELFAIPAVFTLLAWAFAYLFFVLQAIDPGGFDPGLKVDRTWMELLYLSFTTLSSTGLSDITPISGHARSVVMLEQVCGIFYIAMVVTRLVSLRTERGDARARRSSDGGPAA